MNLTKRIYELFFPLRLVCFGIVDPRIEKLAHPLCPEQIESKRNDHDCHGPFRKLIGQHLSAETKTAQFAAMRANKSWKLLSVSRSRPMIIALLDFT